MATGAGFNNGSGGCLDIANIMKLRMELSLRQGADNISQSFYDYTLIDEFVKANIK